MMNMSTQHKIIPIADCYFSTGSFKIIKIFNGPLNALFYFSGERNFFFSHPCENPIAKRINQNKQIIAGSAQLRKPLGMPHGNIKNITMKNPYFLFVKFKYKLVVYSE